ncbi:hypothetical protein Landi51_12365 [Colletotrichum acutatum]
MTDAKSEGSKIAGPAGKVAGSANVQEQKQQYEKPRRIIKPRPQHDQYYEDPLAKDDKVVEEDCFLTRTLLSPKMLSVHVGVSSPRSVPSPRRHQVRSSQTWPTYQSGSLT